jgi:two-component system alkaline phosphatase synthesis response regulator PhoP
VIYILEDDENIRQMETYALKNTGFEVRGFDNAHSFFEGCEERTPKLAILDIMLPGTDGLSVLAGMRSDAKLRFVPVIMVTAKTTELDVVRGLDLGADDYITKPFGIMEFISRVKAILRRTQVPPQTRFSSEGIVLDDEKRQVTARGELCDLTFKEYELLKFLLANQGIVLSRDRIMDRVWGVDYEGMSRTVDMHVKTLRKKLGACGGVIKTVRNIGYKFE